MEFNQLMRFRVIAECSTMTQAARRLYVSQPALSAMLKKLESELGVQLFDRTGNSITLNEAGKLALQHTKIILEQAETMKNELTEFTKRGKIFRVGFCDPGPMWYCTPKFFMLYPDLELKTQIYTAQQDEMEMLQSGLFDLLITAGPIEDETVRSFRFIRDQVFLSVADTDPAASLTQVSLRNCPIATLIRFHVDGVFARQQRSLYQAIGSEIRVTWYEDYFLFHQVIRDSLTPTTSTRIVRHYRDDGFGRTLIPVTDREASIDYYVAYKESEAKRLSPLLKWVELCAADLHEAD